MKTAALEQTVVAEDGDQPIKILHFRSVATQILIVSAAAFCTVGSFNALEGLGGAGQEEPYVANAATSINFGLMGIVCLLGGPIVNVLGTKWSLAIGTIGDPLFAAAVYQNTRYGTQWFLIFASIFRGACSGLFWAAEGFVIIGYPREQWRGRSITTWVLFKELGSIVAASINLGLSANDNKSGHVGYAVYYVTIAIMCLGLPVALLLSPTAKVRHSDGTLVAKYSEKGPGRPCGYKEEYLQLLKLFRKKDVLLSIPYACFAYFYYSFAHTFVTKHFSVRGRALVSLLTGIGSILGSGIVALVSDLGTKKTNYKRNSHLGATCLVLALCAATWGWFGYNAIHPPAKKLDWVDQGFGKLAASVALLFLAMQAAQTFLYWNAAQISETVEETAHLAGIVRGIESLGQCVAYGINASETSPVVSVAINIVLFIVGGGCLVVLTLGKRRSGIPGISSA